MAHAQATKRSGVVARPAKSDAEWGEAVGGLRARVIAVAPETDEQKPDFATAKRAAQYDHPDDVTLLVELKNIGQEPISVQGTRYGDNVTPPWPGKSASETFAPYLFDCEYLDGDGRPVEFPTRKMIDGDLMMSLSSGSAENIEPGKSLVMLIRPTKWDPALARRLAAGDFQIRVKYHGTTKAVSRTIGEHWPDQPLAHVWSEGVVAAQGPFKIAGDPKTRPTELVWGPVTEGLRAAVEFRNAAATPQARRDTAAATFPYGGRVSPYIHVQNVSDKDISFSTETWRQDDSATLIDGSGKETKIGHSWYSGWARMDLWTLKPKQTAVLPSITLGLAGNDASAKELSHPVAAVVVPEPGKYRLRYELHFGRIQRQDKNGKKVIPRENDFVGTLTTGAAPIHVRERIKDDDPPTFTGRFELRGSDGKLAKEGRYEVFSQSGWKELTKGELKGAPIEVRDCPFEPLVVSVRAAGFEEARIYDVHLKPDEITPVILTPAEPARFRLVNRDGKPVAGAEVRYFNRSKVKASVGPYPSSGLKGEVWGLSNLNGEVILDTLQKFDPFDKKLGNNIYDFYVVPVAEAPLFVGPVQAGQDLGEIKVGPFLDAGGEIRGTAEELAAFDAEWDQPQPMQRGDGEVGWHYAESAKLEFRRDGDKLTFHLSDLRPGKLRIVSRFKRGGKPVSHVYTRREPNEDDIVFEIDLQDSRDDLVVTKKK
jgi:hypothetical protein